MTAVVAGHRVFQPGTVLDGHELQDGDCPLSDADPIDLIADDGHPDSSTVCGFADGDERICCGPGAYTAWIAGVPALDQFVNTGNPVALCVGHAEVVRGWVELIRMHTVRPAGTAATWCDL